MVSGQEYVLEYEFSDMLANKSKADLIIKGKEAVFKVKEDDKEDTGVKSSGDPNVFIVKRRNTDKLSTFSYSNQDDIFIRTPYVKGREREFVYRFKRAALDWQITDETKKIEKYHCQKATVALHGRHYEAWFTTEVPINFGPFHLNGLPGLIVQVRVFLDKDEIGTGRKYWKLISVTNGSKNEVFDFHKSFFAKHKVMDYAVYEKAASEAMLEFKRKQLTIAAEFDAKWAKEHGTEPTGYVTYGKEFFTGYLFDVPEGIREKLKKMN